MELPTENWFYPHDSTLKSTVDSTHPLVARESVWRRTFEPGYGLLRSELTGKGQSRYPEQAGASAQVDAGAVEKTEDGFGHQMCFRTWVTVSLIAGRTSCGKIWLPGGLDGTARRRESGRFDGCDLGVKEPGVTDLLAGTWRTVREIRFFWSLLRGCGGPGRNGSASLLEDWFRWFQGFRLLGPMRTSGATRRFRNTRGDPRVSKCPMVRLARGCSRGGSLKERNWQQRRTEKGPLC